MLPKLTDGVLLAVYCHTVRECLKRDSISVSYLSNYPSRASEKVESLPADILRCKVCELQYDPKEVKRVYGDVPVTHGCCSAQCYTKSLEI